METVIFGMKHGISSDEHLLQLSQRITKPTLRPV